MTQGPNVEECQVAQIDAENEAGTIIGFWDEPARRTDHRSRHPISEVLNILYRAEWHIINQGHDVAGNRIAHLHRAPKPGRAIDDTLSDLDIGS